MTKIISVAGPTASGKSSLALELARRFDGEIVSCDSMQIYREMDIGTAKPTPEEMREIPHHMIDIADPEQSFSCAEFAQIAKECIRDISRRGKLPILCGGTGLYIDTVIGNTKFSPDIDPSIRERLKELSADELYEKLCAADPESAEKIHKNNVKRVMRALEIYEGTGVTKSEWDRRSKDEPSEFDALRIVLDFRDRQRLYDAINSRADQMIEAGLADEVKMLRERLGPTAKAAIGYKEIIEFLDGNATFEDAVENLKKASRNYAKRQMTWFGGRDDVARIFVDEVGRDAVFENAAKYVLPFLAETEQKE